MKVCVVTPDKHQYEFEADSWESLYGKYEEYDLIIIFEKAEVVQDEKVIDVSKPSKSGVEVAVEKDRMLLRDIIPPIQEEQLKREREKHQLITLPADHSIKGFKPVLLQTVEYPMDIEGLEKCLQELIDKEVAQCSTNEMWIYKEPWVIIDNISQKFFIEEEVLVGKER